MKSILLCLFILASCTTMQDQKGKPAASNADSIEKLSDRFQINIERFLDSVDIERNNYLDEETLKSKSQLFGVYLQFNNKTSSQEIVSYREVQLVASKKKLVPFSVINAKTKKAVSLDNDIAPPKSQLPRILLFNLPIDSNPSDLIISNQIHIAIEVAP
jgi:hypothetical protein